MACFTYNRKIGKKSLQNIMNNLTWQKGINRIIVTYLKSMSYTTKNGSLFRLFCI